ncbi:MULTISPECIES: hypothetical protein [unclassified Arthrobacter]|uniref:hypothetical protein n=1 Tax=unclassified Arthrobacter TaxID=235627 RepID=UPI001F2D4A41|nr:hypothetical protein [Arthrobacter sp. FW305-BF8]UKA53684.1 hypothetical protein LFT45_18510 [Arthrobacter sp. FW305-BF8]
MITLNEDALLAAARPAGEPTGASLDAGAATDSLPAATGIPRHCRRSMKRLDQEFSLEMAIRVEGQRLIRSMKAVGTADAVTYRCMCGFTIDVPAPGMGRALIN